MNAGMYDGDGNLMLCKCGKPASGGAMGKESYFLWCSDCSPMPKYEAEFVYKDPQTGNSLKCEWGSSMNFRLPKEEKDS